MDVGLIAHACVNPVEPDEAHISGDLFAVVRADDGTVDTPTPLYVTPLSPNSPRRLLNVSFGDTAVLSERACGCPLGPLGWDTHMHTIRSAEKLSAAGATLLDVDIVHILEHELPRAFGGSAMDYQLVEEEREDGKPSIRLLVAPCVGDLDGAEVGRVFRQAVAAAGGAEHVMMRMWKDGDTLHVERRRPYATPSGKVLHMHRGS
jgi:hypothetical protein